MNTQNQKRIAILLPCYNEGLVIADVVADFKQALPQADVYVYDNNSTDNTAVAAREAGAIVKRELAQGKGNVVRAMFRDIEADYYIIADGDGTYDATASVLMLDKCQQENLDMLVGNRVAIDKNAYRSGHIFGNWLLTKIVKIFFSNRFSDILSGYRVFSRRYVKSFPILSCEFEIEAEMSVHALSLKLPIAEQAVNYAPRAVGSQSKLRTYRDGLRILIFIIHLFKDYKPLVLFSSLALFIFLLTMLFFIPVFIYFLDYGVVDKIPTLIFCGVGFMIAILFAFNGLILDSIARASLKDKLQNFLRI